MGNFPAGRNSEIRSRSEEGSTSGPVHFADILATAVATVASEPPRHDEDVDVIPADAPDQLEGDLRTWLLHETQSLREPIYRTEARDASADDTPGTTSEPRQLPLIKYEYDTGIAVLSQMGELTARDLRVMAVISHVFWSAGCPADNSIRGDEATYGYICRQLGLHPGGYVKLVRSSVERLATSKVVWKFDKPVLDLKGEQQGNEKREVAVGFLTNWGARERKAKGQRDVKDNFIVIDPIMAQFIRDGHFTWLRGEVMRRLGNHAIATKLYAYMRTHRPNDRGEIEYGVMNLAAKLGISDKKKSRVTTKIEAAARAIVDAAPDEFPSWRLRPGVRGTVLVLHKTRRPAVAPPDTTPVPLGGRGVVTSDPGDHLNHPPRSRTA